LAELRNRAALESDFAKRFGELAGRHRRELDKLLGNPPDAQNVPASFWEKVQRETEEELVAILLLLFIAASSQHGLDDDRARSVATGFALGRGAQVAASYAQTSFERTRNNFPGETVTRETRAEGLEKVFGKARVEEIAVDNTTAASTAGGEAAIEATVGKTEQDTWFTQGDDKVCPTCGPLHRLKRSDWMLKFPSGPPSHPNCRCWIEYAREKQLAKVEESMAAQLKPFDPAAPTDTLGPVAQSAVTAVKSLLEWIEDRAEARTTAAMQRVLTSILEQQNTALASILESVIQSQREEFRASQLALIEQVTLERERPIEVHVSPAVVNLPEQVQPAPVVNVTVNPELRAVLEQGRREITLKKSGDTIKGTSE
jgi:hypothetical protein